MKPETHLVAPRSSLAAQPSTTSTAVAENHRRCDAFVELCFRQPQNAKHCCTKGCHACCSEQLYVSEAEADHILEALTAEQKAEVIERLNVWIQKVTPVLPKGELFSDEYRKLDAPCPLLKNGLCMVYSRRPMGCRTFFALGNPKDCDLPNRAHQKFSKFSDDLFLNMGIPAMVGGRLLLDHLGVLFAERLLGLKLFSAARKVAFRSQIKEGKFL